jgi:hypothetical protein
MKHDQRINPEPQDFETIEAAYGPLPPDAPEDQRAERYRLAEFAKLMRNDTVSSTQLAAG